jgi:hypothetical protein
VTEKTSPPPTPVLDRVMRVDWFLEALVRMVNERPGASFGVTLLAGGALVSGQLISGRDYFEGFATDFAAAIKDDDAAKSARESIARLGLAYSKQPDAKNIHGAAETSHFQPLLGDVTNYVHLKGARIFHPGSPPIPENRGVWWRGRMAAVEGFMLGELTPTHQP